jgi:hypothetical protein
MPRPTLLVAEPEPGQALSTQKLLLETAKFNVLTAHSGPEALDLFHLFPKLDLVILVDDKRINCEAVSRKIKSQSKTPIVALSPFIGMTYGSADRLDLHTPQPSSCTRTSSRDGAGWRILSDFKCSRAREYCGLHQLFSFMVPIDVQQRPRGTRR